MEIRKTKTGSTSGNSSRQPVSFSTALFNKKNIISHLLGGKAFLCIKKDIVDLIESDEYKNEPQVKASLMGDGFRVPEFILRKMRRLMDAMRNTSDPRQKVEGKMKVILHSTDESRSACSSPSTTINGSTALLTAHDSDSESSSFSPFNARIDGESSKSTSVAGSSPPDVVIPLCDFDEHSKT